MDAGGSVYAWPGDDCYDFASVFVATSALRYALRRELESKDILGGEAFAGRRFLLY